MADLTAPEGAADETPSPSGTAGAETAAGSAATDTSDDERAEREEADRFYSSHRNSPWLNENEREREFATRLHRSFLEIRASSPEVQELLRTRYGITLADQARAAAGAGEEGAADDPVRKELAEVRQMLQQFGSRFQAADQREAQERQRYEAKTKTDAVETYFDRAVKATPGADKDRALRHEFFKEVYYRAANGGGLPTEGEVRKLVRGMVDSQAERASIYAGRRKATAEAQPGSQIGGVQQFNGKESDAEIARRIAASVGWRDDSAR